MMKKNYRILMRSVLLALLGLGLIAGIARAASVVDQKQLVVDSRAGMLAVGGTYDQKLAQVVTAGVTGKLTEVRVPVRCPSTATLIVQIQGVTGGKPNGVVLASRSYPGANLPVDPSPPYFKRLVLTSPVSLKAGTQFAIFLYAKGLCNLSQGPVGNPYPGGDAFFDTRPNRVGVWVSISVGTGRYDLVFQTLMDPVGKPPQGKPAFAGFYPPIKNPPSVNVAVAGQTIPVKWTLADAAGKYLTGPISLSYNYTIQSCPTGTAGVKPRQVSQGVVKPEYNAGTHQFVFNWKTDRSYAGTCGTLGLHIGDIYKEIKFQFK